MSPIHIKFIKVSPCNKFPLISNNNSIARSYIFGFLKDYFKIRDLVRVLDIADHTNYCITLRTWNKFNSWLNHSESHYFLSQSVIKWLCQWYHNRSVTKGNKNKAKNKVLKKEASYMTKTIQWISFKKRCRWKQKIRKEKNSGRLNEGWRQWFSTAHKAIAFQWKKLRHEHQNLVNKS